VNERPADLLLRPRSLVLVGAGALLCLLAVGVCARIGGGVRGLLPSATPRTEVTHAMVVEQVRAVAKLVTSETRVRDVVTYESTWLGSTKRALVVATGRILAGPDLDEAGGADVRVDDAARRITVTLPPARVLAVEVTEMRTYDERSGLWNPFRPADRDDLHRRVRNQLVRSAHEAGVVEHANRSAVALLQRLLAREGYSVDVRVRSGGVTTPTG
jgi:hypothetical protein